MVRLFRVFVPASVLALLISEITLIFCCFSLASYLTQEADPTVFLLYDGGVASIGIAVGSIVLGIYFHDFYSRIQVKSRILLAQHLSHVIGIALRARGVIGYLDGDLFLPRRLMLLTISL